MNINEMLNAPVFSYEDMEKARGIVKHVRGTIPKFFTEFFDTMSIETYNRFKKETGQDLGLTSDTMTELQEFVDNSMLYIALIYTQLPDVPQGGKVRMSKEFFVALAAMTALMGTSMVLRNDADSEALLPSVKEDLVKRFGPTIPPKELEAVSETITLAILDADSEQRKTNFMTLVERLFDISMREYLKTRAENITI